VIEGQKVHDQILNNRRLNLHDQMMFYAFHSCLLLGNSKLMLATNGHTTLHKHNLEIRTVDSSDLVTGNYTDIVTVMTDLLLYNI